MRAFVGFAGFGLVDIALREVGYQTVSVEIDPAVAEVNRANGGNVITADILTLDPADFIGYLLAHFSPPCPNFSLANAGGEETELDIALARWIARFVVVVKPEYFTLENVWAYRGSESWAIILQALTGTGYAVDWWHLNAADYGVPQTRKRMIAIARLDGLNPTRPSPTHRNPAKDQPGQLAMFEPRPAWRGWYEAIEDLIPDLPASEFAPWQMDRMPDKLKTLLMPVNGEGSTGYGVDSPAPTIAASHGSGKYRALLIPGDNSGNGVIRAGDQPMATIQTRPPERCTHRAFIVDCQYKNFNGERGLIIRQADNPMFTVAASANRPTIRAGLRSGRVVSMTVRCLARFQDFPDWFTLPDNRALACYGIGNALPRGLYRAALKNLGDRL